MAQKFRQNTKVYYILQKDIVYVYMYVCGIHTALSCLNQVILKMFFKFLFHFSRVFAALQPRPDRMIPLPSLALSLATSVNSACTLLCRKEVLFRKR